MKVRQEVFRYPGSIRGASRALRPGFVSQGVLLVGAVAFAAALVFIEPTPASYLVQLSVAAAAVVLGKSMVADRRGGAVVLVGTSPLASVAASLLSDQHPGGGGAVLHATTFADAATLVRSNRCAEIIVAEPGILGTSSLVDARGVRPVVTAGVDAIERLIGRVPIRIDGSVRDRVANGAAGRGRLHEASKRAMDLSFGCALGIVALLLLPVVALAIRLDSPGPIFYSQLRVGLNGRLFRIYKFRSMRNDAEKNGATWASVGDTRVTHVGRFLRLSRVDEIPQVWNLLRGEMTLVGPRPERPEFTSMLEAEIPAYGTRHDVKPGLTGWAQVRYRYTASVRDAEAKLEYDLYYVKYRSLALDLQVIARTVAVMVRMRGC